MPRKSTPPAAGPASTETLLRSRGRPRRSVEHEQQRRARISEVARRLFVDEGFEAVSMRRLAQEAGCGTMSLYGYFQSKNAILRSLWEDCFAELFARVQQASRRGTPRQRLERAATAFVDYWCAQPQHYRLVFLNQDHRSGEERYYVDSSPLMERFGLFRELVAQLQTTGQGRAGDPQALSEALICALIGLCHAFITIPEFRWQPRPALIAASLGIVLG
ncbi:TetR/AcrR family transcriptional regulator [Stagnimonas aquatica]|uniref:TetR/AcrR family transcriptional regulator n=1 Tax=Stagnimonas aquatica TaxID=2689987 RepID=A0A3N0VEI2_9GAMM|nr:TetR/AcrR family transcriptional regulator [Stagnimonas aquatica]ROH91075.1 TetR/AcrR family transcriptional regulator [Stagnimonas aquatica]